MSEYTKAKTDKYGNATIGYGYWLEAEVRRLQAENRRLNAELYGTEAIT
jgi:hypothetical protein